MRWRTESDEAWVACPQGVDAVKALVDGDPSLVRDTIFSAFSEIVCHTKPNMSSLIGWLLDV